MNLLYILLCVVLVIEVFWTLIIQEHGVGLNFLKYRQIIVGRHA